MKDGLSQGVVNSIVQDNQSLMWFATEDGLNRFDGYSFKVFRYNPDVASSIPDNYVSSIFKDAAGNLWVSSRKGLLSFDPQTEAFSVYKHQFKPDAQYAHNDVSFITEGQAGNLWVCLYGSGFSSFNKEKKEFTPYTPETLPGLSSEKTVTMLEDKFGMLWVGTQDGGVNVFHVNKGAVVKKLDELSFGKNVPSLNIHSLAEDKLGNIWIGTSKGLVMYHREENKFFSFEEKKFTISGANIISLFVDSNENLWIGTQGGGMHHTDLRQLYARKPADFIFTRIKNLSDFNISRKTIQYVFEDKDKNIWAGTFGDGVYLICDAKNNFIKIQKPLYENSTVSYVPYYGICHDSEGNLWYGTDGYGIYQSDVNGNTLQHFTVEKGVGLKDNAIISAYCDSKGRLWFGTFSQGLFLYNKATRTFTNYRYKQNSVYKPGGNDVRAIFEDSNKNIWVGTNRGGLCLLNEVEKQYSTPTHFTGALQNGDVRALTEDKKGNLWIGFYGDGVYTYSIRNKNMMRHFYNDPKSQLKSDIVFSVKADQEGNIWMGTGGGGLAVYADDKTFTTYTEKDNLANNTIYALLIDNADNIWLSTNAGITRFDQQQKKFSNYNVSDGLQEGQFNPGSALYNRTSGYMCLGGTSGLNIFYPDKINENQVRPEIMLSNLLLFNKPVQVNEMVDGEPVLQKVINHTRHIDLRYDQNVISFEFVGINYSYPEKNLYAYKLDGLDTDWNFVGNQRTATYRYLSPGQYKFKVKVTAMENVWPDEYASISVLVSPPIWKTTTAYVLYVLITVIVVLGVVLVRSKQLGLRRRLKIEKSQRKYERQLVKQKLAFFTEVSHEFKTPLTLIIGPLEDMLANETLEPSSSKKIKLVHKNAQKLLNLINKLLDYRKIESGHILLRVKEDNIVAFTEDICSGFVELAHQRNIRFEFKSDQPVIQSWFDNEKLEMVLTNLISNSFKYIGKGNEVTVHVLKEVSDRFPQGRVVIKIRDNGIGIPKRHLGNIFDWFYKGENFGGMSSGIGLSLAKKLVHLHKGEIFVDSTEGKGSVFSIKIPLGKEHFKQGDIVLQEHDDNSKAQLTSALPEAAHDIEHEDAHGRKGQKQLLIIEDDEEIRGFLYDYFEKDYRIWEAANGKEGLDLAMSHHPDLIISDIMMPEMDGIEFCKLIKTNIRSSHIPVILLTAKSGHAHHKDGIIAGADAYITKPFSPELLRLTVTNLLQARENLMRFYRNLFSPEIQNHPTNHEQVNVVDEKFLKSIHSKLLANLDKPEFNVNELCEELNMSRSLVYKKVKMLTGLSPIEYTRSLRMQEAAKLLKTKKYKVFEVVYMVGFSDLKYFRKCFAKEFGYSPSDFIKQPEELN